MSTRKWEITPATAPEQAVAVHLHSSRKKARKAANKEVPDAWPKGCRGVTNVYFNGEEPSARIHLSEPDLTIQILAHEFAHAAVHLATLNRAPIYRSDDETMPHILSDLLDGATEIGLIAIAMKEKP